MRREGWFVLLFVVAALGQAVAPTRAAAQDAGKLSEVVRSSGDYRLRVRAAMALGRVGDAAAVAVLERALKDRNPSVRAAAATALGQLGSTRSLPAVAALASDRSPAVRGASRRAAVAIEAAARRSATAANDLRWSTQRASRDKGARPRAERVVIIGDLKSSASYQDARMTALLRDELVDRLHDTPGTWVVPSRTLLGRHTEQEIAERALPVLRLDARIKSFHRRQSDGRVSVRCEISFFLLDDGQDSLKAELRGAATSTASSRGQAHQQNFALATEALSAAVTSALANAERAFVAVAKN